MPSKVDLLHKLSNVVVQSQPGKENLVRVADIIRDAVAASQVFLVYVQDRDFLTCGDSSSGDSLSTTQMGLWLVQHQIEMCGGPVAFNIRDGRVEDVTGAVGAEGRDHVGFSVPTSDSSSEMLIIRGPREQKIGDGVFSFVDAAIPALSLVLDRELAASRAARQREQMTALANAAELLIQTERVEAALEDLATAIAGSTNYDLVSIDVYDQAKQQYVVTAFNRGPQLHTSLAIAWRQRTSGPIYPNSLMQITVRSREPLIVSDLQNDERIPEYGREFFKRAHMFAGGQFPIAFHDDFLGVLRVASQRPRNFSPQEIEVVKGFAAQLAVALKAVQMYKALAESEEQLRQYAEQLQAGMEIQHRLARTDALTGIPNRRYVDEVVSGECARAARHKTALGVAIADIDKFKDINDAYGHKAGDEVLIQLADLARRSCRRGDVVGRYGGDEFLFVLPETKLTAARRFADRFRSQVAKHVFLLPSGQNTRIKVSVGVAELGREDERKPSALTKRADEAMYEAKSSGGNKTRTYSPSRRAA